MFKLLKTFIYLFLLIVIIFLLTGCSTTNNSSNNVNSTSNLTNNIDITKVNSSSNVINSLDNITIPKEISAFSTKVFSSDPAREHNISLTCSRLSGTIVKNGDTFSFCNTLGPCSKEKGYQEADSYDSDGDTIKLYGGGNCQVSSTLYNAVVSIPGIEIIERNDHSKPVPYVPKGKDAAVAYGSVDFRFKNNTGYDIKLILESSSENVTAKIEKF